MAPVVALGQPPRPADPPRCAVSPPSFFQRQAGETSPPVTPFAVGVPSLADVGAPVYSPRQKKKRYDAGALMDPRSPRDSRRHDAGNPKSAAPDGIRRLRLAVFTTTDGRHRPRTVMLLVVATRQLPLDA